MKRLRLCALLLGTCLISLPCYAESIEGTLAGIAIEKRMISILRTDGGYPQRIEVQLDEEFDLLDLQSGSHVRVDDAEQQNGLWISRSLRVYSTPA